MHYGQPGSGKSCRRSWARDTNLVELLLATNYKSANLNQPTAIWTSLNNISDYQFTNVDKAWLWWYGTAGASRWAVTIKKYNQKSFEITSNYW